MLPVFTLIGKVFIHVLLFIDRHHVGLVDKSLEMGVTQLLLVMKVNVYAQKLDIESKKHIHAYSTRLVCIGTFLFYVKSAFIRFIGKDHRRRYD